MITPAALHHQFVLDADETAKIGGWRRLIAGGSRSWPTPPPSDADLPLRFRRAGRLPARLVISLGRIVRGLVWMPQAGGVVALEEILYGLGGAGWPSL